ncbi:hypothetical protein JCM11641_006343 [Rhodosporidiobolus odoratus]
MPPFPSAPLSEQGAHSHDWRPAPTHTESEAAAARRAAFEAQEAQRAADLEDDLERADAASQARQSNPPRGTGLDADVEVLLRKRWELAKEAEIIDRILTKTDPPGMGPGVTLAQPFSPLRPGVTLIDAHFKKLAPPKPWTGVFSRRELEDWIESASGYLASHGVTHDYWLNKESTPSAYYAVWMAMRDQWPDPTASETAYHRYRQAKQGSLKVVEFASHLQSLASDCVDLSNGDDDLRDTFFYGLTTVARNYVRGIMASREALTGVKTKLSFSQLVSISSHFDALEATTTSASSSLPRSSHTPSTPTSSRAPKPSPSAPSPSPATPTPAQTPRSDSWVDQAASWQAANPMSKKAEWFQPNARRPYKPVKCYNCVALGDHLLTTCPNSRKDPRTVVVAAVRASLSSSSSVPPTSVPAVPVSSSTPLASVEEMSASGNAEGEEA